MLFSSYRTVAYMTGGADSSVSSCDSSSVLPVSSDVSNSTGSVGYTGVDNKDWLIKLGRSGWLLHGGCGYNQADKISSGFDFGCQLGCLTPYFGRDLVLHVKCGL
ncbi:uncharacterized protein LOC119658973 [Hermetia illucens]|uniref:uncharacterized protein LOC119658973 n=1 Tax=Hermetia illucens TaxID=343691 RepID=UPI0018CC0D4D|nr:uncharacterized protein LOC119658973 [Hermetia illucens]